MPRTLLFGTPSRSLDLAILDAYELGLPIVRISRRQNGDASSLYLRRADGQMLRISDHVIPAWLPAPIHYTDVMLSRTRAPRRSVVRRAMLLLCAGRQSDRLRALGQAAPRAY